MSPDGAPDRGEHRLRLAISLAGAGFADRSGLARIPAIARHAEELGVDQLAVPDHVVLGPVTGGYPFGAFPERPDSPYPEPLTVLAAVAGVTERLELAPSSLIAPLRPAVLLAKTAATLDVLSGGRLALGVGTGWHVDEFDASGVPFDQRGRILDDTIRACRALWADSPASFASPTVSFDGLRCEPRPLRADSIRVWVGGGVHRRTAARIAEYGHGWIAPPSLSVDELAGGVDMIRQALAQAGRDPGELGVKITVPLARGDLPRSLEAVPALLRAGATIVQVAVGAGARRIDEAPAFIEALAERFADYR